MNKPRIALIAALASAALFAPAAASAQTPPQAAGVVKVAPVAGTDAEKALLTLGLERAKAAEQVVKAKIAQMQARDAQIKQLHAELVKAQAAKDAKKVAELKAKLNVLTNQAQLEMIQLQSLVTKQNNAMEMLSSLTAQMAATKAKIIGNLR